MIQNKTQKVFFEIIEDTKKSVDKRFTAVKVWIAHTGRNLNKSNFSKDILVKMIDSLAYTPIVGFVKVDESTNKADFSGHESRLIFDNDGLKEEYLGRMYGFIPIEHNARFEIKVINGIEREYLVADGLVSKKFPFANDILERDGEKAQSMELIWETLDGIYDESLDEYKVTNAEFDALCFLGDSHRPAMIGGAIEKYSFKQVKFEVKALIEEYKQELEGGKILSEEIKVQDNEVVEPVTEEVVEPIVYTQEQYDELQGKLSTSETALAELQVQFKALQEKFELVEQELNGTQIAFELLEKDKKAIESEVNGLKDFKSQVEKEEKVKYIDAVSNLTKSEKKDLVDSVDKYSFEALKDEVAKVIGAKSIIFATSEVVRDIVIDTEKTNAHKSYQKYLG